jgi:hypothetical protein
MFEQQKEKCSSCKYRFKCYTSLGLNSEIELTDIVSLPSKRVFRVPNDSEGWVFISQVRKYINKDLFKVKTYGKKTSKERSIYFQITPAFKKIQLQNQIMRCNYIYEQ